MLPYGRALDNLALQGVHSWQGILAKIYLLCKAVAIFLEAGREKRLFKQVALKISITNI